MVHPLLIHKRQTSDLPVAPTGAGIAGTSVIADSAVSLTSLAYDSTATVTSDSGISVSLVVGGSVPVYTSSATVSSSASTTPSAAAVSGSSSGGISVGTVIGVCVGALAGALVLIFLGLWLYKRGAPAPRTRSLAAPLSASRNARGEHERSRSRLEVWDKLDEGRDTWEGQYQTKEVVASDAITIAPMEKLTMFKRSPSVKTTYTQKSDFELPVFDLDPHPFATYHPNLAQEMASNDSLPVVRPSFAQNDVNSTSSWNSENNKSFVSMRSAQASGMSPSVTMALPTPSISSADTHHFQIAEVVNFDGQEAEIIDPDDANNPFIHDLERRKSSNNPFFNANTSHSHIPKTKLTPSTPKGKGRELPPGDVVENPFSDVSDIVKRPAFTHAAVTSIDSVSSNDRAIQSLIAALDISQEDIEDRLRVASMQPSVMSAVSAYTNDDDELTNSFPLPPHVDSSHTS